NFGSGMTGGLAYILRAEAEDVLHRDFVTVADISLDEDAWMRQVLHQHLDRTGSPRAARLLSRRGLLPMLRVQPTHLQGTIKETWQPILAKLNAGVAIPLESQHAVTHHVVSV